MTEAEEQVIIKEIERRELESEMKKIPMSEWVLVVIVTLFVSHILTDNIFSWSTLIVFFSNYTMYTFGFSFFTRN